MIEQLLERKDPVHGGKDFTKSINEEDELKRPNSVASS